MKRSAPPGAKGDLFALAIFFQTEKPALENMLRHEAFIDFTMLDKIGFSAADALCGEPKAWHDIRLVAVILLYPAFPFEFYALTGILVHAGPMIYFLNMEAHQAGGS